MKDDLDFICYSPVWALGDGCTAPEHRLERGQRLPCCEANVIKVWVPQRADGTSDLSRPVYQCPLCFATTTAEDWWPE